MPPKLQATLDRVPGSLLLLFSFFVLASTSFGTGLNAASPEDLFNSSTLIRISIDISEAGLMSLRESVPASQFSPKPQASARVTENGQCYTNVTVQLKGYSSFRPLDSGPSFTLKFSTATPAKFHGVSKLSLNNSSQDGTRLNEKFAREMFTAAGVPVPRSDYALVTLNGKDLGLYVMVEGFDKEFLATHFRRTDGNLFEGAVLNDIDHAVDGHTGALATNDPAVLKLIASSREPDPDKRWLALNAAVDMDRFLSMVAMETLLCHSDSYSMNRNNYRLYHDPDSDKIVFMPHGMDRILGTHGSTLDLAIVPPVLGMVAIGTLNTTEGLRRYLERVGVLYTNLFQPDRLVRRVSEISERIVDVFPPASQAGPTAHSGNGLGTLSVRIIKRDAFLRMQFDHPEDIRDSFSVPKFDANGIASIRGWKPKLTLPAPEYSCTTEIRDGHEMLHLRSSGPAISALLRAKFSLPAGKYRLSGALMATGAADAPVPIALAISRIAKARFLPQPQGLSSAVINYGIDVGKPRVPEEIEIVCDIHGSNSEVWFDPSFLRLIRVE
jgi:spore coat protein H